MFETIIGIMLLISIVGNVGQHKKIEEQESTITSLSVSLDKSIRISNENNDAIIETSASLEQCIYDLKESRQLQASYKRVADESQADAQKLEDRLSATDWGSDIIPPDLDF